MLERYAETKKYILNVAGELSKSDFIDDYIRNNSMLSDEIVRLKKGDFKIALVAPFSAGKSTLINSIIGKDLLSMDIRAETSVITKISYSKTIKVEITYNHNKNVDLIETDELGQPLTYQSCKDVLKKITTVRDESNEERIKQVVVYYPLEICKDNVEIIDTPGLFSRHEKHETITNNIIPQVNAVIFMIDPDSVGEEHFTDKISSYVQSAKSASLEEDGRHIFFVINKIDVFSASEIDIARHELEVVLSGIINQPNILEVSAYFGLKGKQLMSHDIDIIDIQKDKKINIPDPMDPEYSITGREIKEQHAVDIIEFSRIKQLEQSLGAYLQSKNTYLITDVISSIRTILSGSISKLKFEIKEIQSMIKEDHSDYNKKIDKLNSEINEMQAKTLKSIQTMIKNRVRGGIAGGGLELEISTDIEDHILDLTKKIEREIFKKWSKSKMNLSRENAEDIVQSVFIEAEEFLVLKVKELVRLTFLTIKKGIEALIGDVQQQLNEVTEKMEEVEIKNLGTKMDRIGNMNVENLVGSTMKKIEQEFSTILIDIAKDCRQKVDDAHDISIVQVKKAGVINWFKGLFGHEQYEARFDMFRFKRELDVIIDRMTTTTTNKLQESHGAIAQPIVKMTNNIVSDMNVEVGRIINNMVKIKQNVLENLKQEMDKSEDEQMKSVSQKFSSITKINEISNRFEQSIQQLNEGEFKNGVQSQIAAHK
ncbi:dynamin family protein [Paenibacillus odorifer]|uniref:dynamin family protein n=1 Tax=Paenibacillus odorifer TaxID=189426 RepID=UPI00096F5696|nr:dynamin family protein [Paenibacillus odorifer]OMD92789.1 hypothetical protein BSK67_18680 [Paenibacillus odorifer]